MASQPDGLAEFPDSFSIRSAVLQKVIRRYADILKHLADLRLKPDDAQTFKVAHNAALAQRKRRLAYLSDHGHRPWNWQVKFWRHETILFFGQLYKALTRQRALNNAAAVVELASVATVRYVRIDRVGRPEGMNAYIETHGSETGTAQLRMAPKSAKESTLQRAIRKRTSALGKRRVPKGRLWDVMADSQLSCEDGLHPHNQSVAAADSELPSAAERSGLKLGKLEQREQSEASDDLSKNVFDYMDQVTGRKEQR